jgi:geranylgeranyl pyrophosphate synthase
MAAAPSTPDQVPGYPLFGDNIMNRIVKSLSSTVALVACGPAACLDAGDAAIEMFSKPLDGTQRIIRFEDAQRSWAKELEHRVREGARAAGLVGEMLGYHLGTGGKRLRALLPVWACTNLGGRPEEALDIGAGLELLHNATLVHDDLQDGDRYRRGQPTVWHRWGSAQAINAGDALVFQGIGCILRAPAGRGAADAACHALIRATEGQTMEFQLQLPASNPDALPPTEENWKAMALRKTGALLGACVQAGAIAARSNAATVASVGEHGEALGLLFQVQDDYLDLVGDKGRGARGSDLMEGKLSFPVVWAYTHAGSADVDTLRRVIGAERGQKTRAMVEDAIATLERTGALAATAEWLMEARDAALRHPFAHAVPGLAEHMLVPVAHALPMGPESMIPRSEGSRAR